MIGSRIKKIREQKHYSQEYMAEQLKITQAAYSRIESDQIQINVERLREISKLLDVNEGDLISGDTNVFNFHNNQITNAYAVYQTNLELLEKTIELLKSENDYLKQSNDRLLSLLEQKK